MVCSKTGSQCSFHILDFTEFNHKIEDAVDSEQFEGHELDCVSQIKLLENFIVLSCPNSGANGEIQVFRRDKETKNRLRMEWTSVI